MNSFPILQGERIQLRIPLIDNIHEIIDFFQRNQEHFKRFDPTPPGEFYTPVYWEKQILNTYHEFAKKSAVKFFMFENNNIIGKVNLTQIFKGVFQACFLGYAIDLNHQGQGKMREALELAINYAFDVLNLHRMMANYIPTNDRSAILLKRLGFRVEGYALDYLKINGNWEDHILTALTNSHWKEE